MGVCCAVYGCLSSLNDKMKRKFYRFPLDESRCRQWIRAAGRDDLESKDVKTLHNSYRICDLHFVLSDHLKRKLKHNAVPSLNLPQLENDDKLSKYTQTDVESKSCILDIKINTSSTSNANIVGTQAGQGLSNNTPRKRKLHKKKSPDADRYLPYCLSKNADTLNGEYTSLSKNVASLGGEYTVIGTHPTRTTGYNLDFDKNCVSAASASVSTSQDNPTCISAASPTVSTSQDNPTSPLNVWLPEAETVPLNSGHEKLSSILLKYENKILSRRVDALTHTIKSKNKKMKSLRSQVRYFREKVESLKRCILKLENKNDMVSQNEEVQDEEVVELRDDTLQDEVLEENNEKKSQSPSESSD